MEEEAGQFRVLDMVLRLVLGDRSLLGTVQPRRWLRSQKGRRRSSCCWATESCDGAW